MEEKELTHKFPEWVLSYSLQKAYEQKLNFWKEFREKDVHLTNKPNSPQKFSDLFPSLTESPKLICDKPFKEKDYERYGIEKEIFKNKFWSLRPDFIIENEEQSLIILLDAKSGEPKPVNKIYTVPKNTKPKEKLYYEFVLKCTTFQQKGFFYIIPKTHIESCKILLQEHFKPQTMLQTGFFLWEDLLSIIYEKILETVVEVVSKEMNGLQELREWRKNIERKIEK
jgi:hypothetical protein